MSITQRLEIRQSQSLVMTPQLQQAIKLLQMSNQELGDFIAQEVEQNPLLEIGDGDVVVNASASSEMASGGNMGDVDISQAVAQSDQPTALSGEMSEIGATPDAADGDDVWSADGYTGEEAFAQNGSGGFDGDDEYSLAANVATGPSLREHLLGQIQVDFIEADERLIATALVELLDEAGYLPAELELVRTQLGATTEQFETVIARLQRLDPAGIFARSLTECLSLQLREKNRLDPAMQSLLQHLDLVAKREQKQLMKLCGVDAEDLAQMLVELRQLNPKPASAFTADVAMPITPDVVLRMMSGGGWHVELNSENLPRVLVNERYYTTVQGSARSKQDKEYLSERWQQANWLVKALNQRAQTILKVAAEIVRHQDKFFVHGVQHLRPLILRDIATAVEMHESTVSRVTQNKYIATPRGLFELKYFFTNAIATTGDNEEGISATAVKQRIRELIEHEEAGKILSDDKLAEILYTEGIHLARRTVAKYREAMNIASSAQRRREKRV